jgi:hypothetical protein
MPGFFLASGGLDFVEQSETSTQLLARSRSVLFDILRIEDPHLLSSQGFPMTRNPSCSYGLQQGVRTARHQPSSTGNGQKFVQNILRSMSLGQGSPAPYL